MQTLSSVMTAHHDVGAILNAELIDAMTLHEHEELNRHGTGTTLARSIERYRRFALHGTIPDDLAGNVRDTSPSDPRVSTTA